jgi:hypothetical protein
MPLLENKGLKFIRITHRETINILVEERTVIFIVRYLTDAVLKWIEKKIELR